MSGTTTFEEHRSHLFAVAYRMLGSVTEAEDIVQEAWLRRAQADGAQIEDERAFLTTVVSRLAIDRLRSARHRRETYVGPWLPEPLPTRDATRATDPRRPDDAAELADSLTFAFLTMLDELQPDQRAVVLLHDVFGYHFGEVARMVGRSEAACRQLASRARRRLRSAGGEPSTGDGRRLPRGATARPAAEAVDRFLVALASGDVAGVLAALAPDVVLVSDGGPDHHAARRPVRGPERVGRLLVNLGRRLPESTTLEPREINGEPGVIVSIGGVPFATIGFAGGPHGIDRLWLVRNPSKLAHLLR
jgi:RNA polymerase sigma-70 factor (ECF subfamily)